MPTLPSESNLRVLIAHVANLLENIARFGNRTSPYLLSLIDAVVTRTETDVEPDTSAGIASIRSGFSQMVGNPRTLFDPLIRTLGRIKDYPDADPAAILRRYAEDMDTAVAAVSSRTLTIDATMAAGGANIGNGLLHRLSIDRYSDTIESCWPETTVARCTRDAHMGVQRHEELFELRGGAAARDAVEIDGSGRVTEIIAATARQTARLFTNPSFDSFEGTAAASPTAITGWTNSVAIANFEIDQAQYYRTADGVSTPGSVKYKANGKLSQTFRNRRQAWDPDVPLFCQIAYNRSAGSVTGTLTLRVGSKSAAVVLAAQTGWNILKLDVDSDAWFRNWNENDADIEIEISSFVGTYLLIDDLVVTEYTKHAGLWYALVGGATPFLERDQFTGSVTEPTTVAGEVQHWLWRAYEEHLPHATGGGITWADV